MTTPNPEQQWKLVPVEPTPEILAAASLAAWPVASAQDIDFARKAARIVLMQMDAAPGSTLESIAAAIATMAPAYRAMIAAAPTPPAPAEPQTNPAGYIHPDNVTRLKHGETVVFRKTPYLGESPIPVYVGAPPSPQPAPGWQLIASAPKDGRTLMLGYFNSHGKWRTLRGKWMSDEYIAEYWEDPDDAEADWYETSVESEEIPNCWRTEPTHWQPLPAAPTIQVDAVQGGGNG